MLGAYTEFVWSNSEQAIVALSRRRWCSVSSLSLQSIHDRPSGLCNVSSQPLYTDSPLLSAQWLRQRLQRRHHLLNLSLSTAVIACVSLIRPRQYLKPHLRSCVLTLQAPNTFDLGLLFYTLGVDVIGLFRDQLISLGQNRIWSGPNGRTVEVVAYMNSPCSPSIGSDALHSRLGSVNRMTLTQASL